MAFDDLVNLAAIAAVEEAEEDALALPRVRFHLSEDPFNGLSDEGFVKVYRLSKDMVTDLIQLLEPHLIPPTRISALNAERKVSYV